MRNVSGRAMLPDSTGIQINTKIWTQVGNERNSSNTGIQRILPVQVVVLFGIGLMYKP